MSSYLNRFVLLAFTAFALVAQKPGIQRTIVKRQDVSVPNREAVIARVEIAPGAFVGRHTHPGEEISYIIDGNVDILIDNFPVQHLKAGEAFVIPSGAVHDAHNTGSVPVVLSAVYLVEKGKPMATPAP